MFFSLLQREVLEAAVYFGLSSAVNEARRLFSQWMTNNLLLPPDIRDIIYSTGNLMPLLHLFQMFFLNELNSELNVCRNQIRRMDRMGLLLAALQRDHSTG